MGGSYQDNSWLGLSIRAGSLVSMQKKIFYSIFSTCFCLLILVNIFFVIALEQFLQKEMFVELERQAKKLEPYLQKGLQKDSRIFLDFLGKNPYRLSLIDIKGKVLYDNQADILKMDNHAKREEIKQAIQNGISKEIRHSNTLGEKTLYFALFLKEQNLVLRLSSTQSYIMGLLIEFVPYFVLEILILLVVLYFLAHILTKTILKPILEIDLEHLNEDSLYSELHSFVKKIKTQNKTIKNQFKHLRQKQQEMLLLTENMSDGLILLNRYGNILNTNKSAQTYFTNLENISSIYQLEDSRFLKMILESLKEFKKSKNLDNQILQIQLAKYECEVVISPVFSKNKKLKGMVIVLRNITEKKLAQNLRKEFSANVTHELKTPLTSILASSEMIKNHLVAKEDLMDFINRIALESKRLLEMIDEILMISFLDECKEEYFKKTKINLKNIVLSTIKRLRFIANKNEIKILSNLEDCYIFGVNELLENCIFNLCDNAIKYNKRGGFVEIILQNEEDKILLSIKDSGIGIPEEYLSRIFERFFCVDKSRSKKIGGSGLGLSIVKSALKYNNAQISVKSQIGVGSEFIVYFKREEN